MSYHWLEGWSYLNALYFCVIGLATIGYGDLTPTTPIARLFTIGYVVNGVVNLLALFDRIRVVRARQIEEEARSQRERHSTQRGGRRTKSALRDLPRECIPFSLG